MATAPHTTRHVTFAAGPLRERARQALQARICSDVNIVVTTVRREVKEDSRARKSEEHRHIGDYGKPDVSTAGLRAKGNGSGVRTGKRLEWKRKHDPAENERRCNHRAEHFGAERHLLARLLAHQAGKHGRDAQRKDEMRRRGSA